MRIIFFGSSHGVPERNRRCSSIFFEAGENKYFIDMGTQSIELLADRNINPESINAVFITHMHGDHTNGLVSFLDLSSWYYKSADPQIFLPGNMEKTTSALRGWLGANGTKMRDFRFSPVNEGVIFDDGVIRVTAYKTLHTDASFAYLVEVEGKRVLFGGDMCHKGPCQDFPLEVLNSPLDLAVCEAAHFSAMAYLPIFKDCENLKRLCFTHYLDKNLESITEISKALSQTQVLRATDGFEIVV